MDQTIKKQFIAVRAVIKKDNKYLIIRESGQYAGGTNHSKYDFPGGKVEIGESIQSAIEREVEEETGIKIKVIAPFFVDEWRPIIKNEQIQIIGIFFMCEPLSLDIKLSADHDDYQWVSLDEYPQFALIDATKNAFESLEK